MLRYIDIFSVRAATRRSPVQKDSITRTSDQASRVSDSVNVLCVMFASWWIEDLIAWHVVAGRATLSAADRVTSVIDNALTNLHPTRDQPSGCITAALHLTVEYQATKQRSTRFCDPRAPSWVTATARTKYRLRTSRFSTHALQTWLSLSMSQSHP